MVDPENLVITCDSPERIIGAMDAVMPQLTTELRKRFDKVKMRYWQLHGLDGLYQRVNNRTVSQILAKYDGEDPTPIASGQVDDIRFELFDGTDSDSPHK